MKHVIENNFEIVNKCLKDFEPKISQKRFERALWEAAGRDNVAVCELLINRLNKGNEQPQALYNACRRNKLDTVKLFVANGYLGNKDSFNEALRHASNSGALTVVEWLIKEKNLSVGEKEKWRLITIAADPGDFSQMVDTTDSEKETWKLINKFACSADPIGHNFYSSSFHQENWTVIIQILTAACNHAHAKFVDWILRNTCVNLLIINDESAICKNIPLITASLKGHKGVVKQMIEFGAPYVNQATDDFFNTVLHLTIWTNRDDLNDKNFRINAFCTDGNTEGLTDVLASLKNSEMEASINQQNNFGRTPLHQACILGHLNIVNILLSLMARTDIMNNYNETPYEQAIYNGNNHLLPSLNFLQEAKEEDRQLKVNTKYEPSKVMITGFKESNNDLASLASLFRSELRMEPVIVECHRLEEKDCNDCGTLLVQFKSEKDCQDVLHKARQFKLASRPKAKGVYIKPVGVQI